MPDSTNQLPDSANQLPDSANQMGNGEDPLQAPVVRRRSGSRAYLYLLMAGVFILLLWGGLKGWRLYQLAQSLLAHQDTAEMLMAGDLMQTDPDALEQLAYGLRADVVALKREVAPFLPLVVALGWLPRYGPTLEAAPQLLEMADAGTEAAAYAVRSMKPALMLLQAEEQFDSSIPELLRILDSADADLAQSAGAMERVLAARNGIADVSALNWRIQALFAQFDERLPLALSLLRLAPVLPEMMGMDGPRTYLIIAQNQDELRATGGFISGAGTLVVENGEIVSLDFLDANVVGEWWTKPFDFPPQPLYEYLGLELFLFRDVNFWPDFPTSAEQAMDLASYSLDLPPFDGAIAVDQQFVAGLVAVTGPLQVEDIGVVSEENVIAQLRAAWELGDDEELNEWLYIRKDFLGPFANALRNRLEAGPGSLDMVYLADTLFEAIGQKELQIYMRAPGAAVALDELGWDGRLDKDDGQDFLMVVDNNVGYNKVNPLIASTITYDVALDAVGAGEADLALRYIHGGAVSGEACTQGREAAYDGDNYEELISGCYWNYLRVYAPADSELLAASRHSAPGSAFYNKSGWDRPAETIFENPAFTTFANFFLLPEGEELTADFHYRLPVVVSTANDAHVYRLKVMRQAGVPSKPLVVSVTLPAGAEFESATPEPSSVNGQTVFFTSTLDRDLQFTVVFR